jgi:hypothetical protein
MHFGALLQDSCEIQIPRKFQGYSFSFVPHSHQIPTATIGLPTRVTRTPGVCGSQMKGSVQAIHVLRKSDLYPTLDWFENNVSKGRPSGYRRSS